MMPFTSSKPRTDPGSDCASPVTGDGPEAAAAAAAVVQRAVPYLASLPEPTYVEVATREFPLQDRPPSDSPSAC